jgi:hypothetical protein
VKGSYIPTLRPKKDVLGWTSTTLDSGTGGGVSGVGGGRGAACVSAGGGGAGAGVNGGGVVTLTGCCVFWVSSGVKIGCGLFSGKGMPSARAIALTEQNNKREALAARRENLGVTVSNSL